MKNILTIEQHRELAGHLQFRMDSINLRMALAEREGIERSIRSLRTVLQAQLLETHPDAGIIYL